MVSRLEVNQSLFWPVYTVIEEVKQRVYSDELELDETHDSFVNTGNSHKSHRSRDLISDVADIG